MSAEQAIQPESFTRRSFHYRTLVKAGARFVEINGAAVTEDFGVPEEEAQSARRLGLMDLSPLPRTGFKGQGTAEWLRAQGVDVPGESNRAVRQADGALALRLAPGEVMILGDLAGQGGLPAKLNQAWSNETLPPSAPRGFPVPRDETHAWFLVTGTQGPAMFAKLCAVDLRPQSFPDGHIAQTSLAKMTATLVRDDKGRVPAFHVLADSASAEYLWVCLIDAMAEFKGRPVGLAALRGL
jgi:sarcosine oxidase, subunit gamma